MIAPAPMIAPASVSLCVACGEPLPARGDSTYRFTFRCVCGEMTHGGRCRWEHTEAIHDEGEETP